MTANELPFIRMDRPAPVQARNVEGSGDGQAEPSSWRLRSKRRPLDRLALTWGVLDLIETGVEPVVPDQLGMRAAFGDPALVQHIDAVGIEHRGEPMRDHQGGAPLGEL